MEIHERLRRARESRGLELAELERRTRIRLPVLHALESGQLDALPAGLYARSIVRSYAAAVGLDPEAILAELTTRLPSVEDPMDGLARARGIERVERDPAVSEPAARPEDPAASTWRFAAASAIDGALLSAIGLFLLAASASLCRVSIPYMLGFALPGLMMLCSFITVLYFLLLGGLAGETTGTWLMGLPSTTGDGGPVNAGQAGRRAWGLALRESSVVVELLIGHGALSEGDRPEGPRFGMRPAGRASDP